MTRDPKVPAPRRRRLLVVLVMLVAVYGTACGGAEPGRAAPQGRAPIPEPGGRFAVGTMLLDVEDSRPAEELPDGIVRTIEAQVWYPVRDGNSGPRMPYFPRPAVLDRLLGRGYFSQPDERIASWARMEAHALRNALPALQAGGFPLLLFAPAAGIPAEQYTALLQELASRGFVIVAVSPRVARPSSFRRTSTRAVSEDPDQRAADLSLVLRRFVSATGSVAAIAQRTDLTRAGAFGHAAGGLVALRACAVEAVLQRCASLDGAPVEVDLGRPLPRPFLIVASRPDTSVAQATVTAGAVDSPERWLALFGRADSEPGVMFALAGATTMTFTDAPFVMPAIAGALGQRGEPVALQHMTVAALAAFFGDRRAGVPAAALDEIDAAHAELSRVR